MENSLELNELSSINKIGLAKNLNYFLSLIYLLIDIPEEYEKRKRNDKTEGTAPNKKIRTDS